MILYFTAVWLLPIIIYCSEDLRIIIYQRAQQWPYNIIIITRPTTLLVHTTISGTITPYHYLHNIGILCDIITVHNILVVYCNL